MMQKLHWLCRAWCYALALFASIGAMAQPSPMTSPMTSPVTWDEVRHRFEQNNPTLLAAS